MKLPRDPVLWAAALLLLASGAVGVGGAVGWIDRPFPGFLVLANRVVPSVGVPRWPATRGGEIFQHEIVAVNGRPLERIEYLQAYVSSLPPGTPVRYRLRRDGREMERWVATRRFQPIDFWWLFGGYALCGASFGGTALGIYYLRRRDRVASGTIPMLWLGGVFAFSAMDLYGPYRLFRLNALCETLMFAAMLHMALVFPQPMRFLDRAPGLTAAPYLLALPLVAATQLGLFHPPTYVTTHLLASSALGIAMLVLIASQVGRFLRPPSFDARQRVKIFAFGTAVVLAPPAALAGTAVFTGGQENWSVIALSAALFPLFVGYAVLRHNLLEVDVVLRRSLSYAVLTLVVTGVYVGAVAASEALFRGTFAHVGVFSAALAMIIAMLLLPARDRVQSGIDRVFFRSAYDFRRIVETTSARLASVADLEVIADEIERAVGETLYPEWLTLFARRRPDGPLEPLRQRGAEAPEAGESLDLVAQANAPVEGIEATLAVPFRVEGALIGVLFLGRRRSGRFYGADDRRLLQTLANQSAVAIGNAIVLEQLRELNRNLEAKVEERTSELAAALQELRETQGQLVHREKMASIGQFVAGIAHEINNPLSFIEGNLHFLRRYTDSLLEVLHAYEDAAAGQDPLRDKLEQVRRAHDLEQVLADLGSVLDGCAEGVYRTTSLVRDLRTFSRADEPERTPVHLHEALDSTLNLLRGRLLGIEVVREYGDIPPVECFAAQINQVCMNLLANAADAVGGRGTITVRTRRLESERVAVEVEDDGCGIEPAQLDRIFEPFFTTKGVGRGTGLGLAISYGVVTRHGGTIRVRSHPGQGTCVRVELPVRGAESRARSLKEPTQTGR